MRRRLLAVLVAVMAVALLPSASASAHEQDPHVFTFLDQVIPAPSGVDIQVKQSLVPELVVANPTPSVLEVLNATGRPFLRIGPGGVLADLATPDWYTTNSPIGVADIPAMAQAPDAAPRWVNISPEPSWGWFDHRMHPVAIDAPPPQNAGVTEISRWIVPMRYGAQDVRVLGHLSYVSLQGQYKPALTSSRTPFTGVTVDVLEGRLPGFLLSNPTGSPVIVYGRQGEPFARVGPGGVEVNLHSASWIDQLQFRNQVPTEDADPTAPPDWQPAGTVPRFDWLDTRAQYRQLIPPPAIAGATTPTVLVSWSIPLSQAAGRVTLRGTTSYVPLARLNPDCTLLGGGSGCPAASGGVGGGGGGGLPAGALLTAGLLVAGAAIIAVTWLGVPRRLVPRRER